MHNPLYIFRNDRLTCFFRLFRGIRHLLGATGGYVFGFIFTALVYSVITHSFGSTVKTQAVGLICGLLACYISGTLWYTTIHLTCLSLEGFLSSLLICVVPFIIPDLIKIAVAIFIGCKLSALKFNCIFCFPKGSSFLYNTFEEIDFTNLCISVNSEGLYFVLFNIKPEAVIEKL